MSFRAGMYLETGFTLVEILIVTAILATLIAILLPVFAQVKEKSRQSSCQANMHQIWLSLRMYTDNHDGAWPTSGAWQNWQQLYPQLAPCPSIDSTIIAVSPGIPGYGLNSRLLPRTITVNTVGSDTTSTTRTESVTDAAIPFPLTTVCLCDNPPGTAIQSGIIPAGKHYTGAWVRHRGGANYTFIDGHIKWYRPGNVITREVASGVKQIALVGNNGLYPTFSIDPPTSPTP